MPNFQLITHFCVKKSSIQLGLENLIYTGFLLVYYSGPENDVDEICQ